MRLRGAKMIDKGYLYLLRINNDCCIVTAESLEETLKVLNDLGFFYVKDIANNIFRTNLTEKITISYQKLYNIEEVLRCENEQ